MRLIASFLLCTAALTAGAAEIYRWKDANGVTHYTDYPVAGAERVQVAAAPPSQPAQPAGEPPPIILPTDITPAAPSFSYTSCTVTAPANDESFFGVQPVTVQLAVEPQLHAGHRVQVFVNGAQRNDWPAASMRYVLSEVFRGSHTITLRVVDAGGRTMCSSPGVTFHLRQESVLPPAGQAPRPVPRPTPPPAGPIRPPGNSPGA